jgi:hypothetical protein
MISHADDVYPWQVGLTSEDFDRIPTVHPDLPSKLYHGVKEKEIADSF